MTEPNERGVDAYIAAAPKAAQPMLRQLRLAIKSAAPQAEEKISYRMPYYSYHGRLIYFALHTNHVGLYVLGEAKEIYAKELRRYMFTKSAAHFPIGATLPLALIKKVVKARVKENERNV
ncbi:MAG: iron chaperone [Candidatus Dormibacteraceae bacterium]